LATSPVVPSIRPRAALNCVGTPCGNNQNAFFDSNFFDLNFVPTGDPALGQPYDFSMGVNGTVGGGGGGDLALESSFSRMNRPA
jgi:hypothetical protein